MATAWPTESFPLLTQTKFKPSLATKLDRAGDNEVRVRIVSPTKGADIKVELAPMSHFASALLWIYLKDNAATEFDITQAGMTYRGYIDGESLDQQEKQGVLVYWSFNFLGKIV